jgi:hypothetical protein
MMTRAAGIAGVFVVALARIAATTILAGFANPVFAQTIYTYTQSSPNDIVPTFQFTTYLTGADLNYLPPGTDISFSVTAFTFQPRHVPQIDSAGFPIGGSFGSAYFNASKPSVRIGTNASGQIISWTITELVFASYPAVPNENPNDFFCTYNAITTNIGNSLNLVTDHDAGFCPMGGTTNAGYFLPPILVVTHDFNQDGKSDILWYNNTSGQVVEWLVNGASVIGGGSPGSAPSPWGIVGQRDFNGDGFADLLWRNGTTGQLVIWFVNGTSVIGSGSPGTAASPWFVAGTGDFNGDGKGDILWQNGSTGEVVIWLLNGASVIGGGSPGGAASPWNVAGTGDFNGDGFTDILWWNSTSGQLVIWLLNGTSVIGGGSPGSAAPPWQPFGTGDFNGDGSPDILWRNTSTGQVVVWLVRWLMNGPLVVGGGSPGSVPSPWAIAETGDFNGDSKSDILWVNNTSGQLVVWLLDGASVIGSGSPGSAASPWVIQGMNAD